MRVLVRRRNKDHLCCIAPSRTEQLRYARAIAEHRELSGGLIKRALNAVAGPKRSFITGCRGSTG